MNQDTKWQPAQSRHDCIGLYTFDILLSALCCRNGETGIDVLLLRQILSSILKKIHYTIQIAKNK